MNSESSEIRIHALLNAMLDCVITINAKGLILTANTATERLLGYPRDQLIGRNVNMLMPEPYASAHDAYLQHYMETGQARIIGIGREVVARHADGRSIPVDLSVSEVDDDNGRVFVGILRDLSARKNAEAAQKQLQALLAQIIDGSPVPTFVINDRHMVTHWNRACQEITGKQAIEVIGTAQHRHIFYAVERPTMADLIVDGAPSEQLKIHYRDKRLTRSPFIASAFEAEDYFPKFGGDGCWFLFTAAPLTSASGRIIGAIETLQDVTERRRAEDALVRHQLALESQLAERTRNLAEANRKLEAEHRELSILLKKVNETQSQLLQSEKMASIGQLAAGVAHEINNPIGFVNSNLGTLGRYVDDLLRFAALGAATPDGQVLAQTIDLDYLRTDLCDLLRESQEGLDRVRKIVANLKDFSRVDQAEWQDADLLAGLESTLNVVWHELKYKVDIVRALQPLPLVRCMPAQINQVFLNLLVNAAQAIPQHGTITLGSGIADQYVWVEVADTGDGMDEATHRRMFEPFFTTKPVGTGTGLGMSVSWDIIRKHGGSIAVDSTVGKGTRIRIGLPIAGPADQTADQPGL